MIKILTALLLLLVFVPSTFAAAPALTVSPSIVKIDLARDDPSVKLIYKNDSDKTLSLNFSASDFSDLEEGWQVKFLDKKDAANYKYGLSSWVTFSENQAILAPHEEKVITITVDKDRLTQGGHYASIQAQVSSEPDGKNVQITGILSSLLFARAGIGKISEDAKITQFEASGGTLFSVPEQIRMRFQNAGNVDLTPYGLIVVKDVLGREVARGIVNPGSFITLPETIRRYDIPLKKTNASFIPGIYKATISLHYGESNKTVDSQYSFLSFGTPIIPISVVVVVVFIVILQKMRSKHSQKQA